MIKHKEEHFSRFSAKQLCALLADVENYPEFLPWCTDARVLSREGNVIIAELVISFGFLSERYVSEVVLVQPKSDKANHEIIVNLIEGPFNELQNRWSFEWDKSQNQTKVVFEIGLELKSLILQKMIDSMFESSLKKMIRSFEARAEKVYGSTLQ